MAADSSIFAGQIPWAEDLVRAAHSLRVRGDRTKLRSAGAHSVS